MMKQIQQYQDFLEVLREAGMALGGEQSQGIFTCSSLFGPLIGWHTEDGETDPWEWRMRVLHEERDITYGKLFFKKSGYITKEWFPYFYRIRRGISGKEGSVTSQPCHWKKLEEEYEKGNISREALKIYGLLKEHKELPMHLIKEYGGFTREDKSAFEKGITQLQMDLYISMCGNARKRSGNGEEYGWSSTVFCLTEDFFPEEVISQAARISEEAAYHNLYEQVLNLNPQAKDRIVDKFIRGK